MRNINKTIKITIIIIFVIIINLGVLFLYEPKYKGSINNHQNLIFAHRGFGSESLDNSLSSIKKALESDIDGVEIDAQITKDGEVIIFHDSYLERLTNGKGNISDKTLFEIKSYNYTLNSSITAEKISTFDEVLNIINGSTLVILEIKCGSFDCHQIEQKIVEKINKHNASNYIIVDSFNPVAIYRIKKAGSKIITMFDFRDIEPDDPSNTLKIPFFLKKEPFRRAIRKIIRPDILSIEISVSSKTIKSLLYKGHPVVLWTPNTEKEIKDSFNKDPYAIITDNPLYAMKIRGELHENS